MIEITDVTVVEVRDSRNKPTLEVTVHAGGASGTFSVPSGASTGSYEAKELRDQDGSMATAIKNITQIIKPALIGTDASNQKEVDRIMLELDGTPDKSRLGGNALIGVSIATAKAAARAKGVQTFEHLRSIETMEASRRVPYLYMNYINGGKHASSPISFQEHLIVPDTENVREAMEMAEKISAALAEEITADYGADAAQSFGDEGGYVIQESAYRKPFELIARAVTKAGFEGRVKIAIDVAASSFYQDGIYTVGGEQKTRDQLMEMYRGLIADFPILSIEDPFDEIAFDDFAALQSSTDVRLVGDDLTVTNVSRLSQAIEKKCIRALIVKPNQIGTLSETIATMKLARENNIDCIVSHRSGETMDDFVADLAFAFGAFGLKAGALRKPERRTKYERLATIAA